MQEFFDGFSTQNLLRREQQINQRLSDLVKTCMNPSLSTSVRTSAWEDALRIVIDKKSVAFALGQSLRPAEYHERVIDQSLTDKRILEGFSPELK